MERRARCRICKSLVNYKNPNDLGYHLMLKHPGYNPIYFKSDERSKSPTSNYFSNEISLKNLKKSKISIKTSHTKRSETSSLKTINSCPRTNRCTSETNSLSTRKTKSDENILGSPQSSKESKIDLKEKLKSLLTLSSSVPWMTNSIEPGGEKKPTKDTRRMRFSNIYENFTWGRNKHDSGIPCEENPSGTSKSDESSSKDKQQSCEPCTSTSEYSSTSQRAGETSTSSAQSLRVCDNQNCPKKMRNKQNYCESKCCSQKSKETSEKDKNSVHVINGKLNDYFFLFFSIFGTIIFTCKEKTNLIYLFQKQTYLCLDRQLDAWH